MGRCAGTGDSRTPGSTGPAARRCSTAAPWIRRRDRSAPDRRRSRPGCPCLREARPEDTQGARSRDNRDGSTRREILLLFLLLLSATARYRFSRDTGTALRNRAHRGHRTSRPGPSRSACCIGNEAVLNTFPSAHRTTERSIKSKRPFPKSRVLLDTLTTKATLRDQRHDSPGGTPPPPRPSPTPPRYAPTPARRSRIPPPKRTRPSRAFSTGGLQ